MQFSPKEEAALEYCRQPTGLTAAEIIRRGTLKSVENGTDPEICRKAPDDHKKNTAACSHEKMMGRPGLK